MTQPLGVEGCIGVQEQIIVDDSTKTPTALIGDQVETTQSQQLLHLGWWPRAEVTQQIFL